jgi:hypothetical protein
MVSFQGKNRGENMLCVLKGEPGDVKKENLKTMGIN